MSKHLVSKLDYMGTIKMECEYKAIKLFSSKVECNSRGSNAIAFGMVVS